MQLLPPETQAASSHGIVSKSAIPEGPAGPVLGLEEWQLICYREEQSAGLVGKHDDRRMPEWC